MSTITTDDIRRREEAKAAFNERPDPEAAEQQFDINVPGITDIYTDYEGRTIIGEEVVADPNATDPWDEENPYAGESPAARQIRLGEEDAEDDPEIVLEPPEQLAPCYTEPCEECGMVSDLRSKHTNVTGNMIDRSGIACLTFTCRCGCDRRIDGRQLPPDLCERGDDEADI